MNTLPLSLFAQKGKDSIIQNEIKINVQVKNQKKQNDKLDQIDLFWTQVKLMLLNSSHFLSNCEFLNSFKELLYRYCENV